MSEIKQNLDDTEKTLLTKEGINLVKSFNEKQSDLIIDLRAKRKIN